MKISSSEMSVMPNSRHMGLANFFPACLRVRSKYCPIDS